MPKHRAQAKTKDSPPQGQRAWVPSENLASQTIRDELVMSGNRPHETLLCDSTLEDFGLDDMLHLIRPETI